MLQHSQFSWPQMQTIWYQCCACEQGNHIRFSNGLVEQIKIISAPGPDWEVINSLLEPNIAIRIDPDYLHIWHKLKHYEFKARQKRHITKVSS